MYNYARNQLNLILMCSICYKENFFRLFLLCFKRTMEKRLFFVGTETLPAVVHHEH